MADTRLEKYKVCDQCWSIGIRDTSCVCSNSTYKVIELEFEVCTHCGHLISDGSPADTAFNAAQLKTLKK